MLNHSPKRTLKTRAGFTLIELLVVIAIIALLIGILLPALGRARTAGQLAVSLSNQRQILTGTEQYRGDNDGFLPWYQLSSPQWIGFCSFAFGGKHGDDEWRNVYTRLFDVAAHERVLNPYMYPEMAWDPEAAGLIRSNLNGVTRWTPTPVQKERLELPIYRSPGDKADYIWGLFRSSGNTPKANEFGAESSYAFNGSSYHTNLKWWQLIRTINNSGGAAGFSSAFSKGMRRFRTGADFDGSRFAVYTDEVGLPIYYLPAQDNTEDLINGFGDANRSVMGFFDGHATYQNMEWGAFRTQDYTLVFSTIAEKDVLEDLEEEYTGDGG